MSNKTPLGIFWDIENCAIPDSKSTLSVVEHLRYFIDEKHPECGYAQEFTCACDVYKLGKTISDGLEKSGVTVVHVSSTAKNAAEDKLQELMNEFIDKYRDFTNAVICIISSDINVSKQIKSARKKGFDVVLIHKSNCSIYLKTKNLVTESYLFDKIIASAEDYTKLETDSQKPGVLKVSNLPMDKHFMEITKRLSQLTYNCGGKPQYIENGQTLIRFPSKDDAQRCLNRINGEDVFGNKINVSLFGEQHFTSEDTSSHLRNQQGMSRTYFAQNNKQTQDNDCKSVLKGLLTKRDDDYKRVVMNLVNTWNDPQIRSNLIIDVKRSSKFGTGDGKYNLTIEAVDAKACRDLLNGAEKYRISSNGLKWKPFGSKTVFNNPKSNTNSVIEEIYTERAQNVTEYNKNMVTDWNDSEVRPHFIENLKRDRSNSLVITSQNTNSLFGSQQNLDKNSEKIRDQSMSRTHLAQNEGHDCKSVLSGLFTKRDDDYKRIVMNLVNTWNDPQIKSNLIIDVKRSGRFGTGDGKYNLTIEAVDAKACRDLLNGAEKYRIFSEGLEWKPFLSKTDFQNLKSNTKSFISGSPKNQEPESEEFCQTYNPNQNLRPKQLFRRNDPLLTSVITGLYTNFNEDVTHTVRQIIYEWNDTRIKPNFVERVERDKKRSNINRSLMLFVTANSPQAHLTILWAAAKYFQSSDRSWTQYQPKNGPINKDIDLDSNCSEVLSRYSSTQDIFTSLQNLNQIEVNDEFKSIILGLSTKSGQNLTEIVRKFVFNWNDRKVSPDFITSVERLPDPNNDGKCPVLVTATSPQTCLALVSAAERNLKAKDRIVWHFKSDFENNPKQEETLKQINNNNNMENKSDLNSTMASKNSLPIEAPKPRPRNSMVGFASNGGPRQKF